MRKYRKLTGQHNLAVTNPVAAKEWHPFKNKPLTPTDVTPGSGKHVWWKCSKGHEWQAGIDGRTAGTGCPYCSGKIVSIDNCLETLKPSLAGEWHSTKNKTLTPKDVTLGSNKKVWWMCKRGHEWKTAIFSRVKGSGCPYCSGRYVAKDNCLHNINPTLAKEWHSTKNKTLTPKDVTPGSTKKVWWKCSQGHEWQATIASRSHGNKCPFCSGRSRTLENSLLVINPRLAKEWHPFKNGLLKPSDIGPNSNKKVWWKCSRGHEWQAVIASRNSGIRCPCCFSSTSSLELRIYTEFKYIFKNVFHRKKIYGVENDIYLPDLKCSVELDGFYWHKDKLEQDERKRLLLQGNGVHPIRLREKGLPKISITDIIYTRKDNEFLLISELLRTIIKNVKLSDEDRLKVRKYLKGKRIKNNDEYLSLLYMLPSPLPGKSLFDRNKKISEEWHPSRNGSLTPKDVFPGSQTKVWWQCLKGHEWRMAIDKRNNGRGCPYCSGQKACKDNSLETLNPALAKEWHPTKNKGVTPSDVTLRSTKKVWWICKDRHEWQATISQRNRGTGCPYEARKKITKKNCLEVANPSVAKEWHPTKNKDLMPKDVFSRSHKKVWWICSKGHEWSASIDSRNTGTGCPYCSGNRVCYENSLQAKNPYLAKEWHQTKNLNIKPSDVMPNSTKKVWWICSKGHEWQTAVYHRNGGRGCPYCSGQKADMNNCLQSKNPILAAQWHPTKNGALSPKDVTPGSTKKVWWICSKGHEWQAKISNRTHGRGCPYCKGKRTFNDTCLKTRNPSLAQEWHPTKNEKLTPSDVTPGSGRKVWWLCSKGHEWMATISSRNSGNKCPYCSGWKK